MFLLLHTISFQKRFSKYSLVKMARGIVKGSVDYFECKECGFRYKDKSWAEKCEKWCKEKHSCNLDITSHAIKA